MGRALWPLTALLLCAGTACGPNPSAPSGSASGQEVDETSLSGPVDPLAEAAVIKALESRWSEMYGAGDLEGILGLLAEDSVLIMPEAAPVVGIDAIRDATQQMLESEDEVSWTSDYARVSPSGDMAYDFGTAITTRPDGSTLRGQYLVVWVKEGGEWRVAADMFN